MKLYLTLEDDDGRKTEKLIVIENPEYFSDINYQVEEMVDVLKVSKEKL